jgi:DNA-binding MarR family transcriptional regulator
MSDSKPKNLPEQLPTYKKAALQVVAYKNIRDTINSVLNRFDLNTMQWIILGTLYENATGLRITDIAKSLQVEVPLITTLASPLMREGLVSNRVSKTDRRSKPLALTPRGKEAVGQIEAELAKHLETLEQGLTDSEVTSYFQTLETFITNTSQANA